MVDMPEIPDDDHDFTPDLARKIIGLYQTRIAALEAQIAERVKVKSLEWVEVSRDRWSADVEGFPFYYIVRINLKGHIRIKTFGLYEVFNGTLDEAFAYVQSDHERRVRKLVGVN